MHFDYSKLLGRIRERGFTQETLAKAIGMTAATLSLKLNNKAVFKQSEIKRICAALEIEDADIPGYFFTQEAQEN